MQGISQVRIFLDISGEEPLVRMELDDKVYFQLTIKTGVLAISILGQLEGLGVKNAIVLGTAFDYQASVAESKLVAYPQSSGKGVVGVYVSEDDFIDLYEMFNG